MTDCDVNEDSTEQDVAQVVGPDIDPCSACSYVLDQSSASSHWVIAHGLGFFPSVTTVDSTLREVEGDVVYVDANTITVDFQAAFAGKAFVS